MSNYRTKPIHSSWSEVLELFNPDFQMHGKFPHSQNAFIEWAKSFGVIIDSGNFSSLKSKPLSPFLKLAIRAWCAQRPYETTTEEGEGDGEGLDGSFNTNQ